MFETVQKDLCWDKMSVVGSQGERMKMLNPEISLLGRNVLTAGRVGESLTYLLCVEQDR